MGGEPRQPDGPAVGNVAQSEGVQGGSGNVQNNYYYADRQQRHGPIVVGSVPQAPLAFQPREDLLGQLRAAGSGVSVVRSVTGIRGVGKTQVAAAYARECINAGWRLVAWVNAKDPAEALAGLAAIADRRELGQPGTPVAELGKLVRDRLAADGEQCLLVLDNVTDIKVMSDYIPAAGKAQVVVTTTSTAGLGRPIPVDVFTEEEALAFLTERTGRTDPQGAAALAEELGRLPLALAQAVAVITEQHLTYAVYLDRLRQFPLTDFLTPADDDPYPRGVAEAILLSADAVTASDQLGLCGPLLNLIALLSPTGVTRDLLYLAGPAGALPGRGDPGPAAIDAALGRLARVSLLTFSEDGATVTAHRLVARVTRERSARDGRLPDLAANAYKLLNAVRGSLGEPRQNRAAARDFVAHVTALHDHVAPSLDDDDVATPDLLDLRGWALSCLIRLADSGAQAIGLGKQLLADRERVLGPDHPDTLTSRGNLARAYADVGRLDEAIALHERNLELAEREGVVGPDHPDTLISRGNLASAYRAAGRLEEAIALHERNLAERERVLGSDHPDTLTSRNNLARAYQDAGRLDEAIPLFELAVAGMERILGLDHPNTLHVRKNLAVARRATETAGEQDPPSFS